MANVCLFLGFEPYELVIAVWALAIRAKFLYDIKSPQSIVILYPYDMMMDYVVPKMNFFLNFNKTLFQASECL